MEMKNEGLQVLLETMKAPSEPFGACDGKMD